MNAFNVSSNGTAMPGASNAGPQDLVGWISSLLPFAAYTSLLPDWLKLALIGTIVETARRLSSQLWSYIYGTFSLTVRFDVQDTSHEWVMFWLSQQPAFRKARDVEISTRSWGSRPNGYLVPGEDPTGDDPSLVDYPSLRQRELAYVPSPSITYTLWYKGRYMKITRVRADNGNNFWRQEDQETLELSIMTRDRQVVNDLLLEAKRAYKEEQETSVCVYVADNFNDYWRHVACRPKRALSSIVLEPGIKDLIMDDARDFLSSRAWYAARGIPFRRGYLLHGAPGSGKTSIIHSLAGALGLNIYIISLSQSGMDDNKLGKLIADLPERCIALMEDIDAAFTHGLSRGGMSGASGSGTEPATISPASSPQDVAQVAAANPGGPPPPGGSKITLSGLLNALDGVGAQEGRILFATTNRYSALDPALCRPGRMDLHVEFKLASRFQARELFRCFYMPEGEKEEDEAQEIKRKVEGVVSKDGEKQVIEKEANEKEKEKDSEETRSVGSAHDSGYGSKTPSPDGDVEKPLIDLSEASAAISALSSELPSPTPSTASSSSLPLAPESPTFSGVSHSQRAPRLTRDQVTALSEQFASSLPERELSMAELQGYLMAYKVRPWEAVHDVSGWVEKQRAERAAKAGKKEDGKGEAAKGEAKDGAAADADKKKKDAEAGAAATATMCAKCKEPMCSKCQVSMPAAATTQDVAIEAKE